MFLVEVALAGARSADAADSWLRGSASPWPSSDPASPADGPATSHVVSRRYSDFVALQEQLCKVHPGHAVPRLPGKQVFAIRNAEFVSKRQAKLEEFLQLLLRAPYAGGSRDVAAFLGIAGTLDAAAAAGPVGSVTAVHELLLARSPVAAVLYYTQSLCPVCVARDRMGRGTVFRRAVVATGKQVSVVGRFGVACQGQGGGGWSGGVWSCHRRLVVTATPLSTGGVAHLRVRRPRCVRNVVLQ